MIEPRICVGTLGYQTDAKVKIAYLMHGAPEPLTFRVRAVENRHASGGADGEPKQSPTPTVLEGGVRSVDSPFGRVGVIDLSALHTPGLYWILVGETRSVPFFVRKDAYLRHAYETFYFSHIQRCGCEVPGWHAACHLDDARRRDDGRHIDTVGGWHDAGDLRKWMIATMWQAVGMLWAKRRWSVTWTRYAADDILDELRWGNLYFHKMQEPDTGLVWHDVAGGVEGDNTDNHWTDNVVGTPDDRYINTHVTPEVQFEYAWVQAMCHQAFRDADPAYAEDCLQRARRAQHAAKGKWPVQSLGTVALAYAALAGCEMYRSTGEPADRERVAAVVRLLLDRQETGWVADQRQIRGFFYATADRDAIFAEVWQSAVLPYALLAAHELAGGEVAARAAEAMRLYVDGYVLPMAALSPFGVLPYSAFLRPLTHDHHRPLAGHLTYRFFYPTRTGLDRPDTEAVWWLGTTSHILGHAAALLAFARRFGRSDGRALALRQLEWIHGANPLGANIVSGRGLDVVWPHSRFVGIIPGAVMNGISGNERDEPIFGRAHVDDWKTTEYWSPHQATYLMALAELHDRYDPATDVGVATSQGR